ncbi:MAG: flagella basal body P-ring formation protein FlgA [Pseudooceanicola sp.]|jgi:flagella basal body P-ring formation protein FlgA|nr:flagella basal body P-ring formation protein FlgA [Pseudooceanicola sp.]|tara:strand:+ start:641 stop:1297 length:657 start_codon:yes stop_codon:yes gene_type:complete
MNRLLLSALLCLSPALLWAVPVEELVTERARDSYGAEMPEAARFDIRFQRGEDTRASHLSAFWMDRSTGQFLANAVTEQGHVERLQGLAILSVQVPVPTRRVMPGEILQAHDLQMIDLPYARLSVFAETEMTNLVGKQVRRILTQGRPVMMQSVIEPLVITRGDKVSIRYDDGRLALSAPGRALDDGHRGQEIRIVNLVSNTLVTGIARAQGEVEIIR